VTRSAMENAGTMRLAVLDLGVASFHLAVFEASGRGANIALDGRRSWSETVRLGEGVPGQRMSDDALARGLAAVGRLLGDLAAFDPGCPVVTIAAAALASADGGPGFCAEVSRRHGLRVEPLTGEGEARLSYLGARAHSAPRGRGRLAVADLGATSLALATGRGAGCDLVFEIPLGVLSLRDVYLRPERALDRAARERVAATVRFSAGDAARATWDRRPEQLAFTSGTARALGALADELGLRCPGASEIGRAGLARLVDVLAQFRPIELPALGVEEARSDTVAVGAVVLHTLMELLGFGSAVLSPYGHREGAALRDLLRRGQVAMDDRVHTAVT
jgi:exopolyphosphatase / guanosine-5'-triphosphate,3'-diphosphate pyrophosphatase